VRPVRVTARPSRLLADSIARLDWCDAFEVRLPDGSSRDPAYWRRELFGPVRPGSRVSLLAIRDQLVRPLGLKSSCSRGAARFPVVAQSPGEVVVGLDDRHLDFRASLAIVPGAQDGAHLLVTTAVQRHNLLGRCYFALVRLPHRLLVPRWTAHAVRSHVGPVAPAP
jgi:hypothetical protein